MCPNQNISGAIASNEALQLSFKTKQPTFLVATVEVLLRSGSLGLAVVETASEVTLAVGVRVAAPLTPGPGDQESDQESDEPAHGHQQIRARH